MHQSDHQCASNFEVSVYEAAQLYLLPPSLKRFPECLIWSRKSDIFIHRQKSRFQQYTDRGKDWAKTTDLTQNWNVEISELPSAAITVILTFISRECTPDAHATIKLICP